MNKFFQKGDEKLIPFFIERGKRLRNVSKVIFYVLRAKLFNLIGVLYATKIRTVTKIRRKIFYLRKYLAMKVEGYKFVSMVKFLTMFPPDKDCKHCHGKGIGVINTSGLKKITYCRCVAKKYQAQTVKYEINKIK